ncbi:MAG TPA: hypothetical protein VJ184_12155, partial [Chryseolinea sp.]|nr:hypothetical protein [Chryseolinea sp.]
TKVVGGRHARLSGASLSPDGSMIVAVQSNQDYKVSLQLFDVGRGNKLKEFPNPENNFYSMPRWSDDGKFIAVVKTTSKGKTISKIDVATGTSEDVIKISQENVGHPVLYKNYLFFNSPVSGIDNIYAIDLQTKTRYRVTSSKYAAYNPAISNDGKTIYYNEQSADGLNVVTTLFEPSRWQRHESAVDEGPVNLFEHLVEEEGRPHLLDSIPQTVLPITKYSKFKGILNPYSWGAFITNDLAQLNVGITSRDILSTTSINAGYLYDFNEGTSSWRAGLSYQGLYPIIDLDVSTGNRENNERNFGRDIEFKWNEITAEGGLRIPLQLTNSKYSRQLSVGGSVGLTRVTEFENIVRRNDVIVYQGPGRDVPAFDTLSFIYKDQLNNGDLIYNRFSFSFTNLLKRSRRDFLSKWGQTLDVDFYNTPFGGDFEGRLVAARSSLFFPGLFKHHFIYSRLAYQESFQGIETNTYIFRNRIAKPRGHSYPSDETFFSISANYALPLWYPDIALGPVLNVQRIKANFFYDYGKGTGSTFYYKPNSNRAYVSDTGDTYQSVGVETTFDFNVMRFLPKFEVGFRSTYRFSNENTSSGLVFEAVIGNIGF